MPGRSRKGAKAGMSGWRAFVLGMAGMLALIAIWIVLFETAKPPHADEVKPAGLGQAAQTTDTRSTP